MKVLIIHNKYLQQGGEDKVVKNEIALLESNGHMVHSLIFSNNSLLGAGSFQKIKEGLNALYNRASLKKVREVIQDFNPDIIHIHNIFFSASPSVLFSNKGRRIPIVLTLHNYRLVCSNAFLLRDGKPCELCLSQVLPLDGIRHACYRNSRAETLLLTSITSLHKVLNTWRERVDKYICLTELAKEKFINSSLKLSPEQLVVKPNFVEDKGFNLGERDNFFLFVGRLSFEKGIDVLLESARIGNYHIKIIGDGPEKNKILELAKVNPRIEYLGYLDFSVISIYLKKCLALILPSIWYEGFPVSIVEALAAGTPVIASNLGSMAEILTDNYNGFLFEPGNPLKLHEKIEFMLKNKKNLNYLNTNARQAYLDFYSPEKNYKRLMEIYGSVLIK